MGQIAWKREVGALEVVVVVVAAGAAYLGSRIDWSELLEVQKSFVAKHMDLVAVVLLDSEVLVAA